MGSVELPDTGSSQPLSLQAFGVFEEDISDSKEQVAMITQIVGVLEQMKVFGEENYTPLSTK